MFYGVVGNGTTVNAAASYIFNQSMLTNNNVSYDSTTGLFTFRRPGLYRLSFNTSGTSAAGTIVPTLVLSGNLSTTALAKMSPTAITDFRSCGFEAVVRVDAGPSGTFATMSILNNGTVAETVTSAELIIERIA